MKQKVLFICTHNSARSQMAQAFLNEICGDHFEPHSAGLEPGRLNPLAVEAMREIGIDISQNQTQSVFDVFRSGELFAYAITVCDESSAQSCPIFAGVTKRLHWSFPDPAELPAHMRSASPARAKSATRSARALKCGATKSVRWKRAQSIPSSRAFCDSSLFDTSNVYDW
jgi:arsenate reductase (thioredoxin)